eukprot:scpid106957/ scgid11322/ 
MKLLPCMRQILHVRSIPRFLRSLRQLLLEQGQTVCILCPDALPVNTLYGPLCLVLNCNRKKQTHLIIRPLECFSYCWCSWHDGDEKANDEEKIARKNRHEDTEDTQKGKLRENGTNLFPVSTAPPVWHHVRKGKVSTEFPALNMPSPGQPIARDHCA